jgi:hypothetical protein
MKLRKRENEKLNENIKSRESMIRRGNEKFVEEIKN